MLDPTAQQAPTGAAWNMHPGLDGIPYRTQEPTVPLVKHTDPESMKPQAANEVDVRIFDLDNAEELAEYKKVMNMCARALGRVITQDLQYSEERNTWKVFLTWTTYYYEDPAEAKRNNKQFYK